MKHMLHTDEIECSNQIQKYVHLYTVSPLLLKQQEPHFCQMPSLSECALGSEVRPVYPIVKSTGELPGEKKETGEQQMKDLLDYDSI